MLILDDLLWVLTDSQLKGKTFIIDENIFFYFSPLILAALHFVDSLADLIQESNKTVQRKKAQKKLETLPEYQPYLDQTSMRPSESSQLTHAQKMFNLFDVHETSYHFFSQRIDLHLCDDAGTGRWVFS